MGGSVVSAPETPPAVLTQIGRRAAACGAGRRCVTARNPQLLTLPDPLTKLLREVLPSRRLGEHTRIEHSAGDVFQRLELPLPVAVVGRFAVVPAYGRDRPVTDPW
jgi:hypothetical protein